MTKRALIWFGVTLETSAVVCLVGGLVASAPAAQAVLITLAVVFLLNGLSLQLFASEVSGSQD